LAQTAPPPMAPRLPALQVPERLCASSISLHRAMCIGEGLRFGPQSALDGRPPALMEAGADAVFPLTWGKVHISLSGERKGA
jgi:hypothetical protein